MEIAPKQDLENFSLPLPIYKSIHIADATGPEGALFSVFAGLDENIAGELKKLSLDESDREIQENTDDRKRFGLESYEEWYKKIRTPFALIDKGSGKLAALAWFGPKPAHEGCKCHAAAWRSYPPFRGKGIMKNFTNFVIDFYMAKFPGTPLWVAIKKGNTRSFDLASKLGFKIDETLTDDQSIIMQKKH